jgi:aminopeptidase-like protein
VRPEYLGASYEKLLDVIDILEANGTYENLSPFGEPQLGRRGLYRGLGGGSSEEMALLWVLSLADGNADLLEIAERAEIGFDDIRSAADRLEAHELVRRTM